MSSNDVQMRVWGTSSLPGGGSTELIALRFGRGGPRRILVAGLHGDEFTPVYLLSAFVRSCITDLPGTIDVIPAVNWAGLLLGRRRFPFGDVDLNRALVPQMPNRYARETMEALVRFCEGADLVIELHSWDSPTILMGISHSSSGNSIAIDALTRLGCEYIWIPSAGREVSGTLGDTLSRSGVAHCAVEFNPAWLVDDDELTKLAGRISSMLGSDPNSFPQPPMGGRVGVESPEAGLFAPSLRPGAEALEGQPCGMILCSRTLRVVASVPSPTSGMILQLETRRNVFPGQLVAFIGTGARKKTGEDQGSCRGE